MPPVEIDQLECPACEEITSCAMDQKETKLSCRGQPLQFHGSMSFGSFGQASFQWLCRHSFMAFLRGILSDLWRWVDQWISSHGSPMDSYSPWWKISGRGGCLWELQLHALQRGNGEDRDFAKVEGPSPGCLWCWYRLIPISSSIHWISLRCENLFFWVWSVLKTTKKHHLHPFTICFTLACCKIGHGQIRMRSQTFSTPALLNLPCHGSSLVPVSPGANINVKYDHLFLERYHTCYVMLL